MFEDKPDAWLARRRDRQVVAKGIDQAKVEAGIVARNAARAKKTPEGFQEADSLRAELKAMGVDIMDTPAGTMWKVL